MKHPFLCVTRVKKEKASLTSSRGSSVSCGRELDSRPTRNGVGVQTMSSMAEGSTGM